MILRKYILISFIIPPLIWAQAVPSFACALLIYEKYAQKEINVRNLVHRQWQTGVTNQKGGHIMKYFVVIILRILWIPIGVLIELVKKYK